MNVAVLLCLGLLSFSTPTVTRENAQAAADYSREHGGVSLLVLQNGRTVFERYDSGGSETRAWELASGTKSFSGVMALCAEADGLLNLDEPVSQTLPEWRDGKRDSITLRDLLTLSSGIPGTLGARTDQRVPTYSNAIAAMPNGEPGTRFQYGPVPFQIFGEVMRRKLAPKNQSVEGYLQERIFDPIGIRPARWRKGVDGQPHLPSGAAFTARDWAKFGTLVLNGGAPVLKPGQVDRLWQPSRTRGGYGLTWWLAGSGAIGTRELLQREMPKGAPSDLVMAAGAGGQRLILSKSLNLVVIRQAPVMGREGRGYNDSEFVRILLGL